MKKAVVFTALAALLILAMPGRVLARDPGYCLSCHLRGPQYTLGAFSWQGPVDGEQETLCPGLKRAKQELFLTQSRLAALSAALSGAKAQGLGVSFCQQELQNLIARLHLVLARPVHSLADLTTPLEKIRRDLDGLIYRPLLKMEQRQRQKRWAVRVLGGLLLLLLAAWFGFRRLRRLENAAKSPLGPEDDNSRLSAAEPLTDAGKEAS